MSSEKVKYDCSFQDKWLIESELSTWLKGDKDLTKAYCRLCMMDFSVAKHRVKALFMHVTGSKKKSRLPVSSLTELYFGS